MKNRLPVALCVLLLAVGVMAAATTTARADIAVTDLTGHRIRLAQPAQRILITDGRFLMALALIDGDPVSRLVAWPHDIDHIGPETYGRFRTKFPAIETLKQVSGAAATQSVEQIVAVKPDVAIFPLAAHLSDEQ